MGVASNRCDLNFTEYIIHCRTNFIATAISWNNWFGRLTIGEQRSEMMSLSNENSYLLISHVKDGSGGNHLQVGLGCG